MVTVGKNIELPVLKAVKAEGSDLEMLDLLFDLKIEGLNGMLLQLKTKRIPALLAVKITRYNDMVVTVFFMPPDIWLDFDGQQFQVFLAPNLFAMIHYFEERRLRSSDRFEFQVLTNMVAYLQTFIIKTRQGNISVT